MQQLNRITAGSKPENDTTNLSVVFVPNAEVRTPLSRAAKLLNRSPMIRPGKQRAESFQNGLRKPKSAKERTLAGTVRVPNGTPS